MINLDEIFDNEVNWQMSMAERCGLLYVLNKLKLQDKCNSCIEIGTYFGGSLRYLSKYFNKVT